MNRALLILSLCICWACTEVSYKESQPRGIKALDRLPSKLCGSFFLLEEKDSNFQDTIVIIPQGYRIGFKDPNEKPEVRFLSDSLVVKQYKGYYFVSIREEFEWYLRVLKPLSNNDIAFYGMGNIESLSEEEKNEFLEKLGKEVPLVKTKINENMHYVIDPSPRKLVDLIHKGYFQTSILKRVK